MHRIAVFALAFLAIGIGGSLFSHAAVVKSLKELSPQELQSLRESESRLLADDRSLKALENDRRHKKIGAQDFAWQQHDLVAYIGAEAKFQNDLLTKSSAFTGIPLSNGTRDVLRTVGKYSVAIPVAVAEAILKSGGNFSP